MTNAQNDAFLAQIAGAKEFQAKRIAECQAKVSEAHLALEAAERRLLLWTKRNTIDLMQDRVDYEMDEARRAAEERRHKEGARWASLDTAAEASNARISRFLFGFCWGFGGAWVLDPVLHWLQR
jgi:hypothetical protein